MRRLHDRIHIANVGIRSKSLSDPLSTGAMQSVFREYSPISVSICFVRLLGV